MLGLGNSLATSAAAPSEWTPASVSSLIHWYKYDTDISTYTQSSTSSNVLVTQWSDQKGTNHLVDSSTPADGTSAGVSYNQATPKLVSGVVTFDHGNDQLDLSSPVSLGAFAVYVRMKTTDTGFGDYIFEGNASNFIKIQTSTEARFKISGSRHDFTLPVTLGTSYFNIGFERASDDALSIFINNQASSKSGTGDGTEEIANTLDITKLGDPINPSSVQEVVIFNAPLSASDRVELNNYFDNI